MPHPGCHGASHLTASPVHEPQPKNVVQQHRSRSVGFPEIGERLGAPRLVGDPLRVLYGLPSRVWCHRRLLHVATGLGAESQWVELIAGGRGSAWSSWSGVIRRHRGLRWIVDHTSSPCSSHGQRIGKATSACYSPRPDKSTEYAMIRSSTARPEPS